MFQELPNTSKRPLWWAIIAFMGFSIAIRLAPYVLSWWGMKLEGSFAVYPWNFSPFYALFLFVGWNVGRRPISLLLPLAMLLACDLAILAITQKPEYAFYPGQALVYASFLLFPLAGWLSRGKLWPVKLVASGLVANLLFFLITNYSIWQSGMTYPKTMSGLYASYIAGIPFMNRSLISTALYAAVFFNPYVLRLFMPQSEQQVATGIGRTAGVIPEA